MKLMRSFNVSVGAEVVDTPTAKTMGFLVRMVYKNANHKI